jgi:hypothetical protein
VTLQHLPRRRGSPNLPAPSQLPGSPSRALVAESSCRCMRYRRAVWLPVEATSGIRLVHPEPHKASIPIGGNFGVMRAYREESLIKCQPRQLAYGFYAMNGRGPAPYDRQLSSGFHAGDGRSQPDNTIPRRSSVPRTRHEPGELYDHFCLTLPR